MGAGQWSRQDGEPGGIARRQPLARQMSDCDRQPPRGLSARRVGGVHDGDDDVEAAPRGHQCVLEMEKPVASRAPVRASAGNPDRARRFSEAVDLPPCPMHHYGMEERGPEPCGDAL